MSVSKWNMGTALPFALLAVTATLPGMAKAQEGISCGAAAVSAPAPSGRPRITDLAPVSNPKIQYNFKLELASIFQMISNHYGPLALKPHTVGLNWSKKQTDALRNAGKLETSNDQYFALAELLNSFNDAHVSVEIPSTLRYRLPLQMSVAENRIVVNFIADIYPAGQRKPKLGDQLVSINGKTPEQFQSEYSAFNSAGNEITNRSLFARGLGSLRESRGIPLSRLNWKDIQLQFKDADTGEVYLVRLDFIKEGSGIIGRDLDLSTKAPRMVRGGLARGTTQAARGLRTNSPGTWGIIDRFHDLMKTELPRARGERANADSNKMEGIGTQRGMGDVLPTFKLPPDFKKIELPSDAPDVVKKIFEQDYLFAGTFMRDGKRVGFLRVSKYSPSNPETMLMPLRFMISRLKAESDYLILDQMSNPGGYVVLSDMVVKSLTGSFDRSKHLRFAVKPSQQFLRQYLGLKEQIARNQDNLFTPEEVQDFVAEIDRDYDRISVAFRDKKNLSEPISMLPMTIYMERAFDRMIQKGMPLKMLETNLNSQLATTPVYDKPVFMLIDELCFSGGDATPATLQDYGRVRLIGVRTAGAGGTVESFSHRSQSEMTIHLTTSLMVRKDGDFVENYGVNPDVNFGLTVQDYRSGFEGTLDRLMNLISTLR